LVFGIELEEQRVNLVTQPRCFANRRFALRRQQVEDRRLILSRDRWELQGFAMQKQGHRASVQTIGLVRCPCAPAADGGPARVDLVDRFTAGNEVLCQPAAITPGSLYADSTLRSERC